MRNLILKIDSLTKSYCWKLASIERERRNRPERRRLIALLRMACRVIGLRRTRVSAQRGPIGYSVPMTAAIAALVVCLNQTADAAGIYINDNTDWGCTIVEDGGGAASQSSSMVGQACAPGDKASQTDRVLFYGPRNAGPTALSIGSELYVNGGFIGLNNQTTKSMAIGNTTTRAEGVDSITIGNGATTMPRNAIAIGTNAQAGWTGTFADDPDSDLASIAIGADAKSYEADGVALGRGAITADNVNGATALGAGARSNYLGGVALGSNSVTDKAPVSTANVTINGIQYDFAGNRAYSQVSIGNATQKRQLTNMAAGQINAVSTDGVNGSQLFATNSALGSLGGRVIVNETNISANSSAITNITNGKTGLVQQSAAGENITVAKGLDGAAIDIAGTTAGKKGPRRLINLSAGVDDMDAVNVGQLKGLADAGAEAVKKLGDVAVKYVWDDKNGNGELDAGEVVDYGKVKLAGAGANGTVISNLGNGAVNATSMEAINGSQIFGMASAFGGGAGWNANGVFTGPTYRITVINQDGTLTSKDHDNVGDALGGLDNSVRIVNAKTDGITDKLNALGNDALIWDESKKAFTASHTDTATRAVSGNNLITDLQAGTLSATSTDAVNGSQLNDTNVRVTDVENRVTGVEGDVKNIKTDITKIDTRVTKVEGDITNLTTNVGSLTDRAVTYDGKTGDPKTLIKLQGQASSDGGLTGGTKITNLQQGAVNATSTDAVNGAQLNATNEKMQTLDDNAVKYKLNPDGTKTNEVALQGADPNAPVLISNLEAGKTDTDAVNVKQLKDTVQEQSAKITNQYNEYLDQSKSYTDNRTSSAGANTLNQSKQYTDEKFAELSSDIGSVRSEARQAAAVGLAASSLRYDNTPGKISVAMGGGAWRGQGAAAFGAGYTSESGKVRANVSGAASGGEFGVGAGISFTLN